MKITDLCNYLVSCGIIHRNWTDELDSLDHEKCILVANEKNHILDETARDYIAGLGGNRTTYSDCVSIVRLLSEGEDGRIKTWFTRRYKSPVLNRWIKVVERYRSKNLFIAETARELRRTNNELSALRRRIVELGSKLVELDARKSENNVHLNDIQSKLDSLLGTYGIDDFKTQDVRIREKLEIGVRESLANLNTRFDSSEFQNLWRDYESKFLSTQEETESDSVHTILLKSEELTAYLHAANPQSQHIAEQVRRLAESMIATDIESEVTKISDEITRLRTACMRDREGRRLADLEDQFRDEIKKSESRIEEIFDLQKELVNKLNSDLASLNRDPVDIVFD
jgi:predicted  nucleic acid-binding Zn-ribbon protein